MRNYLFVVMMFISSFVFSQSIDTLNGYPKPYVENGDTIGMIITIEQAQKIDNDYELLKMYEDLSFSYEQGDTVYLSVISKLEEQVSVMSISIETLKSVNVDKDSVITKLNDQISLYKNNESEYEKMLINKDLIIDEKDSQIRKHKMQKFWGSVGSGIAIIGLTLLLILK